MNPPDLAWSWAPVGLIGLGAACVLYARRWRAVSGEPLMHLRLASFLAGTVVLSAAIASPLARLGEQLVSMHTAQHILLTDIGPILLVAGLSASLLAPLLPTLSRLTPHPAVAVAAYVAAIALWHIPPLYDAAVRQPVVHGVQHATMLAAGMVFWWTAIAPVPELRRVHGMAVVAFMVIAKLLAGGVASLLAFAPAPLFDHYAGLPRVWDIELLEDQQLAGTLLMSEQAIAMTAVFALMFVRMLAESDRDADATLSDPGSRP